MKKIIYIAAFAAFAVGNLLSSPVRADCGADIEKLQIELKGPNPSTNVKNTGWAGAKNIMEKAESAHKAGDENKCAGMIKKVKAKMDAARK